jgi:hypothetical protein
MRRKASGKTRVVETPSQLQAMSKAELADAFGPLAAELKPLEKRAEAFKAEFERRGVTLLIGEKFSVQRSETSFDGVDIVAAKAALGVGWCEANSKKVTRTSWKAAALTDADKVGPGESEAAA